MVLYEVEFDTKRKIYFDNMLTNGAIFLMIKHSYPHTAHDRSTLKDGTVNERIFQYRSFRELKIAKESSDLAKVLLDQNQI